MESAVGIGDNVDWFSGEWRWDHRKGGRRRTATIGWRSRGREGEGDGDCGVEESRKGGRRRTATGLEKERGENDCIDDLVN
uniref:Uncharacterized protein n=1 Tax=Oryza punctata TaxID=4537 RepID=A0A0E0LIV4_ORYPU